MNKLEFHFSDVIAFVTFSAFLLTPFIGTGLLLNKWVFHFAPHVPLRDHPASTLYITLWFAVGIPLTFVGKYFWLLVMSRFLSRADVAPLISYGIPRRLIHLDEALLDRYYRR